MSDIRDMLPNLSYQEVLIFQFSSWYPSFKHISIKSTIVRPLCEEFRNYLLADGIQIPEDSEDLENSLDDSSSGDSDAEDTDSPQRFAFPELDSQIKNVISEYGAVFPKLNFSSPKDAKWILPSSSPLKCTSPADIYMLLKASDFITHDITPESVFDGCNSEDKVPAYDLELVLRKWYHVDPSREFRCFVRSCSLLGICQRDSNFYDYMNDQSIRDKVTQTIVGIWIQEIKDNWPTNDYTFDMVLTRDLESGHIIDFNPYAARTDPLLFTYEELDQLHSESIPLPLLKTVDSSIHAAATRNAPSNVHNMVPFDFLNLGAGQTINDFARIWKDEIQRSMTDETES